MSALTALRLRGAIWSERGNAQAVPRTDPGPDELERAVHAAVATPTHRKWVANNTRVAAALAGIERRLIDAGLLLSDAQRRRIRGTGWWMVAVAGLGLVRLLAGIANAKPVGLLVVALLVVTIVAVVLLASAPRRTRRGDRTLAALRDENHALAPKRAARLGAVRPGRRRAGDRPLRDDGGVGVGPGDRGRARRAADEREVTAGRAGRAGATRAARRAAAAAAAGAAAGGGCGG